MLRGFRERQEMSAGGGGAAAGGAAANYMQFSVPQLKALCESLNLHMPSNASKPILQQMVRNHYDMAALNAQREQLQSIQQRQDAQQQCQDAHLKDAEFDDLEAFVCTICYNNYSDSLLLVPRLLPCGHTFCTGCLRDSIGRQAPDTIECGVCRKRHSIPRQAVVDVEACPVARSVPTNFYAKEVIFLRQIPPFQCADYIAGL